MIYIRGFRTLPLGGVGKSFHVSFFRVSLRFVVFRSAFIIRSSFLARGLHLLSRLRESPRMLKQIPRLYCQRTTDPVFNANIEDLVPDPGSVLLLTSTIPHTTDVEYTTRLCDVQAGLSKIGGQLPATGRFRAKGAVWEYRHHALAPADWQLNCQSAGIRAILFP